MPQLNIRIDQDLSERFHKMCADRDTTASEVLRAAITAFVERDMGARRVPTIADMNRHADEAIKGLEVYGRLAPMRSPPIPQHPDPELGTWGARAPYGSRAKKDKGAK